MRYRETTAEKTLLTHADSGKAGAEFETNYRPIAFWVIAAAFLVLGLILFWPFLSAIFLAVVLSVLMYPLYLRLRRRLSPNASASLTLLATIGLIAIPLILVAAGFLVQARTAVEEFQSNNGGAVKFSVPSTLRELDAFADPFVQRVGGDFEFSRWYEENKSEIHGRATTFLAGLGIGALQMVATLVLAILTMFFMVRDGHRLEGPVLDLMPLPRDAARTLLKKMATTIQAVAMGVILVAILQGTLAGLCYTALGVPLPILWGVVTIFAGMIPLVGPPGVYVPLGIYLLMDGRTAQGVILLVLGLVVISNLDTVLRPIWVGRRTDLNYIAIFFSFLGGVIAFGPVGIMAGPVVLTALITLSDIVRQQRLGVQIAPSAE